MKIVFILPVAANKRKCNLDGTCARNFWALRWRVCGIDDGPVRVSARNGVRDTRCKYGVPFDLVCRLLSEHQVGISQFILPLQEALWPSELRRST